MLVNENGFTKDKEGDFVSHGSKLWLGWVAVIQLLLSLVFLDAILLDAYIPGKSVRKFLETNNGQWFIVGTFTFMGIVALVTWLFVLFIPTHTKTLVLEQDHSYRLTIGKTGIEHSLADVLTVEFPLLTNINVKVRLNRRKKNAVVKVSATLVDDSHVDSLEKEIAEHLKKNLEQKIGVELKKMSLRLIPYRAGDKITVV